MIQRIIKLIFDKNNFGDLFIRIAFGVHLLHYSWSEVINFSAGDKAEWLGSLGIPFPFVMSWAYILTQCIGGFSLIFGFKTSVIALR